MARPAIKFPDDVIEKFINLVRERSCLYDFKHRDYKNQPVKDNNWAEIAGLMDCPGEGERTAKAFKNLRDTFVKNRAKLASLPCNRSGGGAGSSVPEGEQLPTWKWYKTMLWLEPYLSRTRPTDECEGAVVQYKYPKTDDPYLNKIHGKIRDYVQHLPREGYLTAKYLCIMTVGPKGGTLMFSGSQLFKLEIPPGAICQQNQLIYMFLHNPPKQSGVHRKVSYSPVVDCGPDGLKFKKPVKLTLPHCAVDTTDLQMLSRLEGSEWNDEKLSFTKIKNGDEDFITAEILHFTKFGVGKLSSVSSLSPKKFACVVYTKEDRARIHIMPICSEETFDSMVSDIGKENGEEGFAKSTMRTRFTYTPGNGDLRVIIHKENERDNILREDDIITEQLMMEMDWYQSIDFTMSDKKFSPTEEYMSAVILLQHNSYPNVSLAQLLVKLQKPDHRYLRQHTGECSYVQPEPLTQNPPDGSNYGDLSQESEGACAPLMRGRSTKCTVEQLCGFHGQLGKPCDCERMTGATSGYLSGASLKCFVDIDFGDNF